MAARTRVSVGLRVAAGLLALAYSGFAFAESATLTKASVKKFIASYPEIKVIAISEGTARSKKIGGADNPLLAVVEAASDDAIKGKIDVTAQRHGFLYGLTAVLLSLVLGYGASAIFRRR